MTIPTLKAEIMFVSPTWTDVTQWLVQSAETARGSSRVESPVIRYEPGHATIRLDNRDRRFDPTNLSGPYVSGGKTRVTAMRPCRLQAIWNSVTYPLFRGYTDEFGLAWLADIYSEVTVPLTDGFKVLANRKRAPTITLVDGKPVISTFGEGDNTGARVTRILDSAGWPVADRTIAVGNSTLQATPLSGNVLEELQTAVESEAGEIYMDASGKVVFRNRHALSTDARSTTVQATFGNTTPLSFVEVNLSTDDGTLWNEAIITRNGGNVQIVEDTPSVTEFLYRTFDRSGLMLQDDITARNYGQWIVYTSKDPELRFESLTLYPQGNPTSLFPQVLTREIGDRIQIIRQPPGGGSPVTRDVFIRGIHHSISQERWITTWTLQSATRYVANFFNLDSATTGVLNQNTLSF